MGFITKHTTAKQRNILGATIAFVLSLLFSGIGILVMLYREYYQSKKYVFPIETDDVIRYSISGSFGCICNSICICCFL